ncbi:sushi domain-containing protein 6 isoform X1 [Esox lucius]|uniref:Sushi domain-containing protein n=2 Tax=Esox lucius TaxID=8010 RepID=A0AAY5K8U7_ESOLU|nr:sushi domain-containing protein 6 isoform X1 [Esox lucius]
MGRKSVLMSARVLPLWLCGHLTLGYGLFLIVALPDFTTGRPTNCTHPLVPEHGGFRCDPTPCRGFPHKSSIQYFCEPGYSMPLRLHRSRCVYGEWKPSAPPCLPTRDRHVNNEDRGSQSLPSVATTAVGVSIFLLTTTACMVIKSRLYPCHSHSRCSSDQVDLMVDGLPVSLPTYEEAIYGSWGQRLPPCGGPAQLLLAQEAPGPSLVHDQSDFCHRIPLSSQSPEMPPPAYEDIQSHPRQILNAGDIQVLQVAHSDDK